MSESQMPVSRQQRRAQERMRRKQDLKQDLKQDKFGKLSTGAALTLGAAALAGVPAAQAATFTVTNLNDSGAGSLRQAIADADAALGPDVIQFQAGLTGTITLTSGQLSIYDSVDIQGPGPAVISVSGNSASRVFYLYNAGALVDVTISGLTITGGGAVTFGAGIIDFGENLILDDVVISGNVATAGGGGIAWTDQADGMTLTIRDSSITGNDAGRGGGIYSYLTGGLLTIENSVISGNDATVSKGGGVYLYQITDDMTITGSTISGNTALTLGGGIYFYQTGVGAQTIDHSTIDGNSAGTLGGGLLGVFFDTPFTFDHSTISNNDAPTGGGMFVVFPFGAPVTVVDSTVSGNQATVDGGGIFLYGLYAGGTFDVLNSTVASNTAVGTGGGIFSNGGAITVANSIAGDNTAAAMSDLGNSPTGSFAVSFSLVESAVGASITDNGGNIFNQDPQLGPLANNGGLTETHLPAQTSPAVDAGNPAFVPPPSTDQRDLPRVVNGRIDMGSVELAPPLVPGTIQLTFSSTSVGEAAGIVTVTATRTGGSDGAVSVTINTVDGTAVAPGDYGAVVAGMLSWADGDTAPKTLDITIVNDTLDEPDENFIVTISNPTGGATLGSPATATITILDDDEPAVVVEVPTVGEWGMVLLTGLFTMSGIYMLRRKRGLAAPMLVLTLAAGGTSIATATTAAAAATPATPAATAKAPASVQANVRDARAALLSELSAGSQAVTLRLSDGTLVQVNVANLEIKDRRNPHERFGTPLRPQDLAVGQPLVVKVRRGENGVVKKVRVQVFDTLAHAQQALQRQR